MPPVAIAHQGVTISRIRHSLAPRQATQGVAENVGLAAQPLSAARAVIPRACRADAIMAVPGAGARFRRARRDRRRGAGAGEPPAGRRLATLGPGRRLATLGP